jgi:hypothetical protein
VRIPWLLLPCLLLAEPALGNPLGRAYQIDVRNFAGVAGTALSPVQFDRIEEAPPGLELLVSEDVTPVAGGELIEMSFRSPQGSLRFHVPDPGASVRIGFAGLSWEGGGGQLVRSSFFLYFAFDGTPQLMQDLVNIGLDFRPHPLGRTFGGSPIQVLFFPLPNLVPTAPPLAIPIDTEFFPTTFEGILLALGLDRDVTELRIGFTVLHAPEPGVAALLGLGLFALGRRRSRAAWTGC